jgi:hypothetical protein
MLDPASTIIKRFGGIAAVADMLKLNRTSVLRWTHPRERGGTGGLVPTKHQADLMAKARERGVAIKPADFFAAKRDVAA